MGHPTDLNRMRMNKRIAQMQFLLDNFEQPEINYGDFNRMEVEENGYCPTGITMTIINFTSPLKEYNYSSICSFMNRIQTYLPKDLRITTSPSHKRERGRESPLWNQNNIKATKADELGEETKEYLDLMVDWFTNMKAKCLNDLTFSYIKEGKNQFIEIMKRRWKDTYSEKVEQEVQAAVKADNNINLIFEDA